MTPMQHMLLGIGSKKKVFLDDVFSTYLYKGTSGANTVNNGLDISGEGGLVWIKNRTSGRNSMLFDTVRGVNQEIATQSTSTQNNNTGLNQTFTSTGFTFNTSNLDVNSSSHDYASWSFRKAPGFFDVVTYTGNATTRTISHSLGSVPGLILIKDLTTAYDWFVYHKSKGNESFGKLNTTNTFWTGNDVWNSTSPTSTNFTINGNNTAVNTNTNSYVAYIFAGGESTAATARSVEFDGNGDYLVIYNQADLSPEAGDFTLEMWIKPDLWATGDSLVYASSSGFSITRDGSNNALKVGMAGSTTHLTSTSLPEVGQWTHVAVTRSGTTMRLFFNGVLNKSATVSHNYASPVTMYIVGGGGEFNGKISNFRFVKGTAVYTSSFRPPTEPLANITNTKLLCCNGSAANSSTVTPGTINAEYDAAASTESPFDDPAGLVFGESGSESVIKCGSYKGLGTVPSGTVPPTIFLGWEPSWVMIKRTDSSGGWRMYDNMRGLTNHGDPFLYANASSAETTTSDDRIKVTSTGFVICPVSTGDSELNNGSGTEFVFLAIRRPDPLVQKPQLATDVFAMGTGNGSSNIPSIHSGFPVDMMFARAPASSENWYIGSRLTKTNALMTNSVAAGTGLSSVVWDSNSGAWTGYASSSQGWMWKRHAGFDVVTYIGNATTGGVFQTIKHSLGKTPEMIWIKSQNESRAWTVGHIGLNGGTNPWQHYVVLDNASDENGSLANGVNVFWGNGAPSATHFNVGDWNTVNENGKEMVAMLFASCPGISSVGSYTGNASTTGPTVTTGFQPRLIIAKAASRNGGWLIYDSLRGFGTQQMTLNSSNGQSNSSDMFDVSSTGFSVKDDSPVVNGSNESYLYYAHA